VVLRFKVLVFALVLVTGLSPAQPCGAATHTVTVHAQYVPHRSRIRAIGISGNVLPHAHGVVALQQRSRHHWHWVSKAARLNSRSHYHLEWSSGNRGRKALRVVAWTRDGRFTFSQLMRIWACAPPPATAVLVPPFI
jgi:hypothetical protein